jgi:predicted RNA-binding protein YlqC (UPF0109 family)
VAEQKISHPTGDARALVEQVAKTLVDEPDAVSVSQVEEGSETILELTVAPNDLGKVIGKQGRTARAIRALLNASGLRLHKRFELEILE